MIVLCSRRGRAGGTIAAFLAVALMGAVQPVRAQEHVTAFVNVSVIPMDRERVLTDQTVVVKGDRIVAIGPAKQTKVPSKAVRVDGAGKFLLPGLADMDVGLPENTEKDSTGPERTLFLALANGVTTIRAVTWADAGGYALRLKARTATGEIWGPRMYVETQFWNFLDTTKNIDENISAYKAAGYDFIALGPWGRAVSFPNKDRRRTPDLAALQASRDAGNDSAVIAARRVGLPVGGSPYKVKQPPAELLMSYNWINGVDTTVAAAAAKAGVGVCEVPWAPWTQPSPLEAKYGPAEYRLNLGRAPGSVPGAREYFAGSHWDSTAADRKAFFKGIDESTKALQDAGARLLLCSGGGSGSWSMFFVHRLLQSLVHAGLTPYQALAMGTRNAAAFLGTQDSTGTVEVGKRADLMLLNANPLEDIRHSSELAGVMVGGRWVDQAEVERRLAEYYH